jgi:hypothetical protein
MWETESEINKNRMKGCGRNACVLFKQQSTVQYGGVRKYTRMYVVYVLVCTRKNEVKRV